MNFHFLFPPPEGGGIGPPGDSLNVSLSLWLTFPERMLLQNEGETRGNNYWKLKQRKNTHMSEDSAGNFGILMSLPKIHTPSCVDSFLPSSQAPCVSCPIETDHQNILCKNNKLLKANPHCCPTFPKTPRSLPSQLWCFCIFWVKTLNTCFDWRFLNVGLYSYKH